MENKNILNSLPLMVCAGIALIAVIASFFLMMAKNNLTAQLTTSRSMLAKMQDDAAAVKTKAEEALQEKEKLQADAISYIGVNTNLQREKDELEKKVAAALEIVRNKEMDLEQANSKLKELDKRLAKRKVSENGKLDAEKAEKEKLTAQIAALEGTLAKERGLYHYNLAVAYSQAKLYDEAIDEYEKSLSFNANNPEAQYNLGVLFENVKGDPEAARERYQKYLELSPNADDKDEVRAIIERLGE